MADAGSAARAVEAVIERNELRAIEPPPPFLYLSKRDDETIEATIGRALISPRAPTLQVYEISTAANCVDLAKLAQTIGELVPKAARIEHPLVTGGEDWRDVVSKTDGSETLHVLSPPEPRAVDVIEIARVAKACVGPVLVDVPDDDAARAALPPLGTTFTLRCAPGRIFCATFAVAEHEQVRKLGADPARSVRVAKLAARPFDREIPILKTAEERYVLGVVLEPETIDAQRDIYSVDEVKTAAHAFLEDFRNVGLMHQALVNGRIKICESYLAPVDFTIGTESVKRGTWLLGVRVVDDDLWAAVKGGELTGFSIGGFAQRVPEGTAPSAT
jgi:hypothetical protein